MAETYVAVRDGVAAALWPLVRKEAPDVPAYASGAGSGEPALTSPEASEDRVKRYHATLARLKGIHRQVERQLPRAKRPAAPARMKEHHGTDGQA